MEVVLESIAQIRTRHVRRYHTEKTREIVELSLKAYDEFIKSSNADEQQIINQLRASPEEDAYFFLDNMVQFWASRNRAPKTIRTYFTFIRAYLRQCRIKTTSEGVREYVSFPKIVKEIRRPLTITQIKQLLEYCGPRQKAFFLVLVSSGMRASEALSLKVIDINRDTRLVKIRAEYTKTKQERETYISKEAMLYLEPFLKGKTPGDKIFTMDLANMEMYMGWLRQKTKLLDKYGNGVNYMVNIHAFRAYFHTKATLLHGVEYAHAVLGHGSYLQQYFRLTDEERLKKYQDLEPYLTIYDDQKTKAENERLKEKVETIDELKRKNIELEDRLKRLEMKRK